MLSSGLNAAYSKVKDNYSLATAMFLFSNNICADSHDKVYGLMGIVRQEQRLAIDYNNPPQDVFQEAFKVIIARANSWAAYLKLRGVGTKEFIDTFEQLGRGMNIEESKLKKILRLLKRWFKRRKRISSFY